MPTYSISAPNGKTYEIVGPAGATDEQVRQKVLEQHPDAGSKPSLSFADQAASFVKQHGRELATGLGAGLGGISGGVLGAAAGGIGAIPGGVAGSALGAGAGGQAFDIASHYLGGEPTAPIAQLAVQLGKDVGFGATAEMGGQVAGKVIGAGAGAIANALKYGTEAKPAIEAIRGKALAELLAKKEASSNEAALATGQARRAETKAATLANRQTAAASKATPAPFSEGRVTTLDERGQPIQTDVVKAKEAILQKRGEERAVLSQPVDEAVKAKETSGVYISNTPDAKALLKESKSIVNPNATKSPTATSLPTPEEASVHKKVIDALDDRLVEVPESFATSEKAAGMEIVPKEVTDFATGERSTRYFRKFKTTYEAVDNLRRRFGDAYHGKDATGFEGVSENLIKDMYGKIRNIQKNYVGEDLYNPLQESYAKYTKALAPFNETQIGKSISGTQGTTDIANLTPSQVPGAVLSKGAGGFEQVQALGGNPTRALADEVATAFHNPTTNAPKTAAEVRALLHNSDLGSAVNANPTVKAAVAKHLTQLEDAEMAGVRAEDFKVAGEKAATKAEKFFQVSEKSKVAAENLQSDINAFESLKSAKEILSAAKGIVKNHVPTSQQPALYDEINKAYQLNKEKGIRDWIKKSLATGALGAVGLGGAGAVLHKVSGQ